MAPNEHKQHLQYFQNHGYTDSLLEHVRISGRDMPVYIEALDSLSPIFQCLSFGEQPNYKDLDQSALRQRKSEVVDIVKWMLDSPKADMKTVAIELIGFLGWSAFRSALERRLNSGFKWERLTVVKALGQIPSKWAADLLRLLSVDPDLEIREAVNRALTGRLKSGKRTNE